MRASKLQASVLGRAELEIISPSITIMSLLGTPIDIEKSEINDTLNVTILVVFGMGKCEPRLRTLT